MAFAVFAAWLYVQMHVGRIPLEDFVVLGRIPLEDFVVVGCIPSEDFVVELEPLALDRAECPLFSWDPYLCRLCESGSKAG